MRAFVIAAALVGLAGCHALNDNPGPTPGYTPPANGVEPTCEESSPNGCKYDDGKPRFR